MSNLRVIHEISLHDIPGQLRQLAEDIEAGKHGDTKGVALVLDNHPRMSVLYWGTGEAGPNAHLLLHIGAAKMVRGVLEDDA